MKMSLPGILFFAIFVSVYAAEQYTFPKIQLPDGDFIHNAMLKSEDAMSVTFWSDEGIFRIAKTDLRPEIARFFPYDPQVAREEAERERKQIQAHHEKVERQQQNIAIFNQHAVQLKIYMVRGHAPQGVYVKAFRLGKYSPMIKQGKNFFGNRSIPVQYLEKNDVDLGDIYLRGVTPEQVAARDGPVYACYVGTDQATETVQSITGFSSTDKTVPAYTVIKSEAGDYYRNQEDLRMAQEN